ncbi:MULTISPECIES: RteC domain-containing protein [Dysgonomonas]|uniref:RteC domain-containing protein n=1 Tax=Dysgonomonas TaxID=156973 RepID=UPI00092A897E|nr:MULTISPECIES: RteC domain-containing protein [Dysgonomonas]MBN9302542.1 RteC domain-containing protein [Dysgonomonas mossii]OJX59477.1 MAG: hypothetical protein BGO84_12050 [Dysgonomonas sp. 37-18]
MIQFSDSLQKEVDQSLLVINAKESDTLKKAEEITSLLTDAFNRLRVFIYQYEFKDEAEEILFFKEIKPNLFCDLIYYQKMYNLEIHRPTGGYPELKIYLEKELARITDFFDKNRAFYRYYRSNETSMDCRYFLRGQSDNTLYHNSISHERDPLFSTVADLKLTRILANNKLEKYIYDELAKIDDSKEINGANPSKVKLTWTVNKVFLIELIYALYLFGAFNYGKATLKEIISYFEDIFNIDLGANPSKAYFEMRNRKQRTTFLDRLREILNNKMDEDNEK